MVCSSGFGYWVSSYSYLKPNKPTHFLNTSVFCITPVNCSEPVAPVRKKKEKPAPVKKSKNPPVVEDDEEDEDDEVTWDSISELKVKDLKTLCKTKDLDTDPEDYDDDIKSFRKAAARGLGEDRHVLDAAVHDGGISRRLVGEKRRHADRRSRTAREVLIEPC